MHAYFCGWGHWGIGSSFTLRRTRVHFTFGHHWAPRYCITWYGFWSYWHMHGDDPEFDTGWSGNWEPIVDSEGWETPGSPS